MADFDNPKDRLSQIDAGIPANNESADKTPAMVRQLWSFLKAFLANGHNDDGTIKSLGVGSNELGEGAVRGSDSNTSVDQNEVKHATISTPDIRNLAVSTAKINDLAVTAAKIADATITATKMAADAIETAAIKNVNVTTSKLADNSVTAAKLAADGAVDANRAITTNHIKDGVVTNDKLANTTIAVAKMASQASATLLAGSGSAVVAAVVGGALTATYDSGTNSLLFAIGGITQGGAARTGVVILEKAINTALLLADSTSIGGIYIFKFTGEQDPADMLTLGSNGVITVKNKGFYLVWAVADIDSAELDQLALGSINAAESAVTAYPLIANGMAGHGTILGYLSTTSDNEKVGLCFANAAPSATIGTAKNKFAAERYASIMFVRL